MTTKKKKKPYRFSRFRLSSYKYDKNGKKNFFPGLFKRINRKKFYNKNFKDVLTTEERSVRDNHFWLRLNPDQRNSKINLLEDYKEALSVKKPKYKNEKVRIELEQGSVRYALTRLKDIQKDYDKYDVNFKKGFKAYRSSPHNHGYSTISTETMNALHDFQKQSHEWGGGYSAKIPGSHPEKLVVRKGKRDSCFPDTSMDLSLHTHPKRSPNYLNNFGGYGIRGRSLNRLNELDEKYKSKNAKKRIEKLKENLGIDSERLFSKTDLENLKKQGDQSKAVISSNGILVASPEKWNKIWKDTFDDGYSFKIRDLHAARNKFDRPFKSIAEAERHHLKYNKDVLQNARKLYSHENIKSKFFPKGQKVTFIQMLNKDNRRSKHNVRQYEQDFYSDNIGKKSKNKRKNSKTIKVKFV